MANIDSTALFKIGYGLYVVTSKLGDKDNGLILNSVMQVADAPQKIAVSINKKNYSHDIIKETKKMNLNCLTEKAPFDTFKNFGFQSGRDADKFKGIAIERSENGLAYLKENVNAFISLEVTDYIDMGSHGMFICEITESCVFENGESMTYAYYHKNVKPKPSEGPKKKGFRCKICGYVYEGEVLPDDFICPWCKHPKEDFEPIE